MLVKYRVNDDCEMEVEVPGIKEAFRFLAYATEVFGIRKCRCGSDNVRPDFRLARTGEGKLCEYYSHKCGDCESEFKFGQKQDDAKTLFPKGWEDGWKKRQQSNGESQEREPAMAGGDSGGGKLPWE